MFSFSNRRQFLSSASLLAVGGTASAAIRRRSVLPGEHLALQASELVEQVNCIQRDIASLPPQVREWILNSGLVKDSLTTRVKVCTEAAPYDSGKHEDFTRPYEDLKRVLLDLAFQQGNHREPIDIDGWFKGCTVEKNTKRGFTPGVHADYANPFDLRSRDGELSITFSSGLPALRVAEQPWMHITSSYTPDVTLNTTEIAALEPTATYFDRAIKLYNKDNRIAFTPFPDTPRLAPTPEFLNGFRQTPPGRDKNAQLKYVRYYVTSVSSGGKGEPLAFQAFAYTRGSSDMLQMYFVIVQGLDRGRQRL
jgi:hypothetical protein